MRLIVLSFTVATFILKVHAEEIKPIPRKIPPVGISIPQAELTQIKEKLKELKNLLSNLDHPLKADAEVYYKAVDFAVQNGEFYKNSDFKKAKGLLTKGVARAKELKYQKPSWTKNGIFTRAYKSAIDNSIQPYGLEIPDKIDLTKKSPVWIWLHGRGDKTTDMHFVDQRDKAKYKFPQENAIVIHPFGRQCIGYKSAGEIDILELLSHVKKQYNIDEDRIALMGFSMGGAGAWHLGAHYAQKWAVVHAGAGFAETAQYTRLKKEDYPTWYEQKLWGLYDVPDYTQNLFNLPVISYSGEKDKQIQAAQVMEKSFSSYGKKLNHLIGPNAGHKYAPGYFEKVTKFVRKAVDQGRNQFPSQITLQTKTLRYSQMHWLTINGLKEHWLDTQIMAKHTNGTIDIKTKNVHSFTLSPPKENMKEFPAGFKINIDKQIITLKKSSATVRFTLAKKWLPHELTSPQSLLNKRHALQGPIDDAFLAPFLIVTPSKKSSNKQFQRWMDFEIEHLKKRWRELFRGEVRIKKDIDVNQQDIEKYNLILWGDSQCNSLIKKYSPQLPIKWDASQLKVNNKTYSSKTHVPILIYPNGNKYLVLNSGPTFREGHDRTNSLQNPKLPDWAVIDIRQDPGALAPGKVIDAGFFNETWKWKKSSQ